MVEQFAYMESSGPWYSPLIRAHCMLGRRSAATGLMSYEYVKGQITKYFRDDLKGKEPPSDVTAWKWEKAWPSYPEDALARGLVKRSELLPWAMAQIRPEAETAPMEQGRQPVLWSSDATEFHDSAVEFSSVDLNSSEDSKARFGQMLAGGVILYAGYQLLRAVFGSSSSDGGSEESGGGQSVPQQRRAYPMLGLRNYRRRQ